MSEYYHSFTVGFNWWYVTAPVIVVLVSVFSYMSVQTKKTYKPQVFLSYKGKASQILLGIIAAIFTFQVAWESIDGIIQTFDNGLSKYESGMWSLFMAGVVIMLVWGVYFVVLSGVYRFVQVNRKKYLDAIYEARKNKQLLADAKLQNEELYCAWRDAVVILMHSISTEYRDVALRSLYLELDACIDEDEAKEAMSKFLREQRGDDEAV